MRKIHQIKQRSEEWFALRKQNMLTASSAGAIGNQGVGLKTLCWKKLAEKYSTADKEKYTNNDLERGVELEPQAIAIYELKTGNKVEAIGFVTDDEISKVGGASPDGAVGEELNIEVKCPDDPKYFKMLVDYKKTGSFEMDSGYLWQVQMQMLFMGSKKTDFIVFNPNYSESLLIKRVEADAVMQQKIITGLKLGEGIINEIEANIN